MPVHLDIAYPDDNLIELSPVFLAESSGSVEVRGRGNHLRVDAPLLPNAARIVLGGGATVTVGMDSNLNRLEIHAKQFGLFVLLRSRSGAAVTTCGSTLRSSPMPPASCSAVALP
ncbi:hypothetical protein ASF39_14435 [Methylobacterium sp. Leaf108]|nr:hypothetical protein ASF39_14435 [Methylobacterium sp. Leaf108]